MRNVYIGSSCILGGSLTINGNVSLSGNGMGGNANLEPGYTYQGGSWTDNTVGTIVVNGNLTMTNSSVIADMVVGAGGSDLVAVSGVATLAGTIDPNVSGSLTVGTYKLMTYGSLAAGSGMSLGSLYSMPKGFFYQLNMTSSELDLVVTAGKQWTGSGSAPPTTVWGTAGNWYNSSMPGLTDLARLRRQATSTCKARPPRSERWPSREAAPPRCTSAPTTVPRMRH